MLRRFIGIQLDQAVKGGARQIDETQTADNIIYIHPDRAEECFALVFSDGLGLANTFPSFRPINDLGYAGNIDIIEFAVLNNVPAADPWDNRIVFNYPTVHVVMEAPIKTYFLRYFGINEINVPIHADSADQFWKPN